MNTEQFNEYDRRIKAILGDYRERTLYKAERYHEYLVNHLSLPILVTGTEDFPWEEPYILGGWDRDEYEELKKSNPSYTDTFEFHSLKPPDRHDDIMAKVRRISDGKRFAIGLSWLCCLDQDNDANTFLEDYGIWYTNY